MNEVDTKCDTRSISRIEHQIREINQVGVIITSGSGEWEITSSDYFPGHYFTVSGIV